MLTIRAETPADILFTPAMVAPDEVVGIVRYRDEFDAAMSE
jgi:hypothetical protein